VRRNNATRRVWLCAVFALAALAGACATSNFERGAEKGLTFSAIGDGPREEGDWPILRQQIESESAVSL